MAMHQREARHREVSLIAVAAMMLIATEARADIPIPAVFGLMAPSWLAVLTFGVSLAVVVAVEALVLLALLRVSLGQALKLSLIANVITTAYGFVFWTAPMEMVVLNVLLVIVLFAVWKALGDRAKEYGPLLIVLMAAPIPALAAMVSVMGFFLSGHGTLGLFASLIPALCATTVIELFTLRALLPGVRVFRATAVANGASYALIALTLWTVGMRAEENPLLTPDYLYTMEAPVRISVGDMESVFAIIEQIREINLGTRTVRGRWLIPRQEGPSSWISQHGYPPWGERRIARDLAAKGHVAEAIEVLEFLLEAPGLREEEAQLTRERIAELEARLAREGN
jgi:hypothetical protein